ncbi:hypothetical protein MUK42_06663 [Musa troglodytarum]|uniref:Uncharacterized protein n=1 Tax=Musa troglodytarum TaxID=320322 RepID=A0A9E7EJ93_9LILI|nr:hypothetical protein MUK42_06663 [Musa troglodytarum]
MGHLSRNLPLHLRQPRRASRQQQPRLVTCNLSYERCDRSLAQNHYLATRSCHHYHGPIAAVMKDEQKEAAIELVRIGS